MPIKMKMNLMFKFMGLKAPLEVIKIIIKFSKSSIIIIRKV
jgi:hypothetical protein